MNWLKLFGVNTVDFWDYSFKKMYSKGSEDPFSVQKAYKSNLAYV
ncbi:MAG: hypothetical protein RL607_145 [Bacteroidota bacterium]|jgi:hypothetical protein